MNSLFWNWKGRLARREKEKTIREPKRNGVTHAPLCHGVTHASLCARARLCVCVIQYVEAEAAADAVAASLICEKHEFPS